jgi:hypothetical protein
VTVAGKGGALSSSMPAAWLTKRKDRIIDGRCFARCGINANRRALNRVRLLALAEGS